MSVPYEYNQHHGSIFERKEFVIILKFLYSKTTKFEYNYESLIFEYNYGSWLQKQKSTKRGNLIQPFRCKTQKLRKKIHRSLTLRWKI